jgi:hypothetical protein
LTASPPQYEKDGLPVEPWRGRGPQEATLAIFCSPRNPFCLLLRSSNPNTQY